MENINNDHYNEERLAGAVVYASKEREIYFALVQDTFEKWTLAKGKIERNEDPETTAIREIREELGIDIKIVSKLKENQYPAFYPHKQKTIKNVTYFLAESEFTKLKLGSSKGLIATRWMKPKDVLKLNLYKEIVPVIETAINSLMIQK